MIGTFDNAIRTFRESGLLDDHSVESGRKRQRLVSLSEAAQAGELQVVLERLNATVAQQSRTPGEVLRKQ